MGLGLQSLLSLLVRWPLLLYLVLLCSLHPCMYILLDCPISQALTCLLYWWSPGWLGLSLLLCQVSSHISTLSYLLLSSPLHGPLP